MANNCKQCFNTHYQPHCHPLPKAYDCVAVYITGRRTNLVVYGCRPKRPTKNKLQWNLKQNSNFFIQENAFENVVCEMVAILYREIS